MREWERRTTFKVYSCHAGRDDKDRGNVLILDIDAWTKRRYIIEVYRRMLRAKVASQLLEHPSLTWMQLFLIWRGIVRADVFDLLFAAHLARDTKFAPYDRQEVNA
jgi:hypothetical protein